MGKKLETFGWCMFDWANSSYTTVITTVAFNLIFTELIIGPDTTSASGAASFGQANLIWSVVLCSAWFLTAMTGPFFGALSDATSSKKIFLGLSVAICSIATGLLYFINPGDILFCSLVLVISHFGFSMSENIISSFLPHLSTEKNIGKISGLAWGLGYFGGLSSILLVSHFTGFDFRYENFERLRLTGPLTAAFFVMFSLPTFLFLKEPRNRQAQASAAGLFSKARKAYSELISTFRNLHKFPDLTRFLASFFFFQGGVAIVFSFANIYGKQVVGLDGSWIKIFFISLQLTAAVGAFGFGILQDKLGALLTLNATLVIWIATILAIYNLKAVAQFLKIEDLSFAFVIVGNFAGLCLGATQASARAMVGIFAPKSRSGEFYGFWGFFGKMSAVFTTAIFGVLQHLLGLEKGLLCCASFFIIGLILNYFVNEKRGRQNALVQV